MIITVDDMENDVDKYLEIVQNEEVLITENDKLIAVLSKPDDEKMSILSSLVGIAKGDGDVSLDKIKTERLSKYN